MALYHAKFFEIYKGCVQFDLCDYVTFQILILYRKK